MRNPWWVRGIVFGLVVMGLSGWGNRPGTTQRTKKEQGSTAAVTQEHGGKEHGGAATASKEQGGKEHGGTTTQERAGQEHGGSSPAQ